MQVKLLFSILKSQVFTCLSFSCFFSICGFFLEWLGSFLASLLWVDTYRHRFGTTFGSILESFGSYFGVILESLNVVEGAPQARPKTTAVANTVLRPSPCSSPSLNALPVPLLRQVFFIGPKLSSHAGKTHFFTNTPVF